MCIVKQQKRPIYIRGEVLDNAPHMFRTSIPSTVEKRKFSTFLMFNNGVYSATPPNSLLWLPSATYRWLRHPKLFIAQVKAFRGRLRSDEIA
jgi:hypothetical protein